MSKEEEILVQSVEFALRGGNKANWGEGPWEKEPDHHEFSHAGFRCIATRHPRSGNFCGYVVLEKGHPWYGVGYNDVDADVHGGLTAAGTGYGGTDDSTYSIGFDCGHGCDFSPGHEGLMRTIMESRGETYVSHAWGNYKDLQYVIKELMSLAEQAKAAAEEKP